MNALPQHPSAPREGGAPIGVDHQFSDSQYVDSLASRSPTGLIADESNRTNAFQARLVKLLNAVPGAPCTLEVVSAALKSVRQVADRIDDADPRIHGFLNDAKGLEKSLRTKLGDAHCSAPSTLKGKRSEHPVWVACAEMSFGPSAEKAALVLMGCALLKAFRLDKAIPQSIAKDIVKLRTSEPLSEEQLHHLLWLDLPEDAALENWVYTLRRSWREVMQEYGGSQETPQSSATERIRSQVLGSALNGKAAHMAGALDHRLLTPPQFEQAVAVIAKELAQDTLKGILGFTVLRTGLSVDVAAMLELGNADRHDGISLLDLTQGLISLDLSIAVHEAGKALPGCIAATPSLNIHLPQATHRSLQARFHRLPQAKTLADLFPEQFPPAHDSNIFPSTSELKPTWSRLRYTLGLHLRLRGVNKLLAAFLSGDLGIIPRSKLHYAVVQADEIYELERSLHIALGLDSPVQPSPLSMGTGCRVVPEAPNITLHDAALAHLAEQRRPGKRSTIESIRAFHNAYTRLCAWRLSVLLALRETRHVDLDASIDARNDEWVAIHDKHTQEDRGHQPVPICAYVAMVIQLYKAHCQATAARMYKLHGRNTPFSLACMAVAAGENQRLLMLVDELDEVDAIGSGEFTASLIPGVTLPPDVGRKVMENELRGQGVRSSDVDAFLRHFTRGQEPASAFDPASLSSYVIRTSKAQQAIASKLLGPPLPGLSQGDIRKSEIEKAAV